MSCAPEIAALHVIEPAAAQLGHCDMWDDEPMAGLAEMPPILRLDLAVIELLGQSGIEANEIVAVVNSHLHFDHCGQNPALFDGPTAFLAQAAEYETVAQDPYYTDAGWALAPEHQRRVVNGDEQLADGVTILATPGHTAGHQSVLVEAGGRRVVIGAQMVWHADELDSGVVARARRRRRSYRRSAKRSAPA